MFAFDYGSSPVVVEDVGVNFHAKVLRQRLTHGVGFNRGYCEGCSLWATPLDAFVDDASIGSIFLRRTFEV